MHPVKSGVARRGFWRIAGVVTQGGNSHSGDGLPSSWNPEKGRKTKSGYFNNPCLWNVCASGWQPCVHIDGFGTEPRGKGFHGRWPRSGTHFAFEITDRMDFRYLVFTRNVCYFAPPQNMETPKSGVWQTPKTCSADLHQFGNKPAWQVRKGRASVFSARLCPKIRFLVWNIQIEPFISFSTLIGRKMLSWSISVASNNSS